MKWLKHFIWRVENFEYKYAIFMHFDCLICHNFCSNAKRLMKINQIGSDWMVVDFDINLTSVLLLYWISIVKCLVCVFVFYNVRPIGRFIDVG
jgi:hypothetical protein